MQNFMKTILSGIQKWTKKEIKDNAKNSTADWNQNDSSAANYVKNRTHWEEEENVSVLNKTTVTITDEYCEFGTVPYGQLIAGQTYYVTLNGVEYKCVARYYDEYECVLIGNGTIYGDGNASNNEPFCCDSYDNGNIYLNATAGEYTVSISCVKTVIHKLDSRYLDIPTNIATTDDVQEAVDVANEAQSAANTAQSTADGKMDANNPVGTGSFSINRKEGTVVGNYSSTLGLDTIASARSGVVYGEYNINDAYYVVSENKNNFNSIYYISSSYVYYCSTSYSFDEKTGIFTLTSPITITGQQLANSYTDYIGYYFVYCGGIYNFAINTFEGNKLIKIESDTRNLGYTTGMKTLVPTLRVSSSVDVDRHGSYAHIVGNGTSDTERSNAHTLDWNGVGWFQGGLQVGGNAQDDGAKSVLLEGDAIPIPENATVGQTIAVKSVDENGKPVEWEATDFSASGGSGCIASDIAPEDTSVLWIDTADNSDDTLQDAVNIALAQAKESGEFKGDPGKTPEKGVDYYTDTDKAELVSAVLSALPAWTGGSY